MKIIAAAVDGWRRIKQWVRTRGCRKGNHGWETVGVNAWGISIEEYCRRCGQYRHHLFEDVRGFEYNWRSGRHPGKRNQTQ